MTNPTSVSWKALVLVISAFIATCGILWNVFVIVDNMQDAITSLQDSVSLQREASALVDCEERITVLEKVVKQLTR